MKPTSFSGHEDAWHDWSLKFAATAAALAEHACTWLDKASRTDTEITLVMPSQGVARIFAETAARMVSALNEILGWDFGSKVFTCAIA